MSKELVGYVSGYANFAGLVDPSDGKIYSDMDTRSEGTDDYRFMQVFPADGVAVLVDTDRRMFRISLRTGKVLQQEAMSPERDAANTAFPSYGYANTSAFGMLDHDTIFNIASDGSVAKMAAYFYKFSTNTFFGGAAVTPNQNSQGNIAVIDGVLFIVVDLNGDYQYRLRKVVFNPDGTIASTTDGTDLFTTTDVYAAGNNLIVYDGTNVKIFNQSLVLIGTLPMTGLYNGGISYSEIRPRNARQQPVIGNELYIGGIKADSTKAIFKVDMTAPVDWTWVCDLANPVLPNMSSLGQPSYFQGIVALANGKFAAMFDSACIIYSATGVQERILPGMTLRPREESSPLLFAVTMDTYKVVGTTSGNGLTLRAYDQATKAPIGAPAVSAANAFSISLLGSGPVRVVCDPPNAGLNPLVSDNIAVTLEA